MAAVDPSVQALIQQGMVWHQQGQLEQARTCYEQALQPQPEHPGALHYLGVICAQLQDPARAVTLITQSIELQPLDAAARYSLGNAYSDLQNFAQAVESYQHAVRLKPDMLSAHANLGLALAALGQHAQALASHERALALRPNHAPSHNNRGLALLALHHHQEALASFGRAILYQPDYAEAYSNRGNALTELRQFEAAVKDFEQAIALAPQHAQYHYNLGIALVDLKQYVRAIACYETALALEPRFAFLHGELLNTRMQVCDWKDLAEHLAALQEAVARGDKSTPLLPMLAVNDALALQKQAAETWIATYHPPEPALGNCPRPQRRERIHIGYFSADFHNHATSYLMAQLFELHDRSRFELTAFSFGPDVNDAMRQRVRAAFDHFIDVRSHSDLDVARLARERGVDIAIDLKGFTQDGRVGIFAARAAPVQVSYLGYPGTLGAPYMDYLIADATLIPAEHRDQYSEKIISLPFSYQVNDGQRRISEKCFTRADMGLPEQGFVFCCFNNNYKILPAVFEVWMRLLQRVPGSVLWLLQDNPLAAENLRREAAQRGIEPARLVFAERLPLDQHLARQRLADLFLDTLPYNAHTTASDALWAGLPVLSCAGQAFASRVGASLLNAIGLPELVVNSLEDYEALALALVAEPARLTALRQRLAENRLSAPLFDTPRFTRHLEAAYEALFERAVAGLPPEHLAIPA